MSEGTICLARVKSEVSVPSSGYLPLQGDLGTVDLETDPVFVAPWIEQLRIFAGYAGWGPGQLEEEMELGRLVGDRGRARRRLQRRPGRSSGSGCCGARAGCWRSRPPPRSTPRSTEPGRLPAVALQSSDGGGGASWSRERPRWRPRSAGS